MEEFYSDPGNRKIILFVTIAIFAFIAIVVLIKSIYKSEKTTGAAVPKENNDVASVFEFEQYQDESESDEDSLEEFENEWDEAVKNITGQKENE